MTQYNWNILRLLKQPMLLSSDCAVLILNQKILCNPELIRTLWSKGSILALVDGGCNRWLDFIEKESASDLSLPHFFSGDSDSIVPRAKAYFESRGVKYIATPDEDENDFTKALKYVLEIVKSRQSKLDYVFAVCEYGGRFDHIMGNINTLFKAQDFMPNTLVLILSSQCVTWVLPEGKHTILVTDEFVDRAFHCGLIPIYGRTMITTSGFLWDMKRQVMEFGQLVSTSNTYAATEVKIMCDRSIVWTTEYC